MGSSTQFNFGDIIIKTEYFQECLENLLAVLQSPFHCLDLIVKVLLYGPDGAGKRLLAKAVAKSLSMNFCEERASDLFDENIVGTEKKVRAAITKQATNAPCLIYLTGYEIFSKLEDPDLDRVDYCISESFELLGSSVAQPIIFIAATNNFDQVYHSPLSDIFQHHIPIKSLNLSQTTEIVNLLKTETCLESLSNKTPDICLDGALYLGNLMCLLSNNEIEHYQNKTVENVQEEERTTLKDEGTRWIDIGGLNNVKQDIIDAIQLSIDFPQLKKSGLRRTGVLLYGPPGTGKTLLAKAVATECSLNFINVKGPELLNEYVGQSEDNIRKLFRRARESSPCVIFFDELDSLAPNRGQAGDSGGVMDRMVSQILTEMDGVGKSDGVFVIGATNRVDLVDSSLLRPGRFDKVLEVPLPTSKESRLQILAALTRKMKLSPEVKLEEIESIAPANMSGADFQGLCSKASHKTFDRCINQVELGLITEDEIEVITTLDDFVQSLEE